MCMQIYFFSSFAYNLSLSLKAFWINTFFKYPFLKWKQIYFHKKVDLYNFLLKYKHLTVSGKSLQDIVEPLIISLQRDYIYVALQKQTLFWKCISFSSILKSKMFCFL